MAGANCLDLFAGSGVLGFEAMSRGAKSLHAVELNSQAADAWRRNAELLDLKYVEMTCDSVANWLTRQGRADVIGKAFDIVFIDPPYGSELLAQTCAGLVTAGILRPAAKIYLENSQPIDAATLPSPMVKLKDKKAGSVHYYLFAHGET